MALTIWLVRHGETSSNADGMFQGHLDVALNERGERQALAVGEYLRNRCWDAVFASDLQRAARTAELIVGDRAAVTLDPDLREMHYGVLQGVRYVDAAHTLAAHGLDGAWKSGELHRRGWAIPGGESSRRFRGRSSRFVRRIDAQFPADEDHQILVVAHGGKLGVLMTVLLGLPARSRSTFRFANCSISRLTRTVDRTTLDFHNLVVSDESLSTTALGRSDRRHDPGESHHPRK